jgi:hypothetical protein
MLPTFIGPSYNLESRPASVQRTVNLVPVPLEPGNERSGWVFRDVPGLVEGVSEWDGPAPDPIQFITATDAVNTDIFTVPAHQAGDLIVVVARGTMVGAAPATPAGWTSALYSGIESVTPPLRIYYKVDTDNSIALLPRPGTTANLIFLVYRNTSGIGLASMTAEALGPTQSSTPSLGTLTAGSWVVGGADINQASVITKPAARELRAVRGVGVGGGTGAIFDSNGVLTSYAGGDVSTWSTGAIQRAYAFELLLDVS